MTKMCVLKVKRTFDSKCQQLIRFGVDFTSIVKSTWPGLQEKGKEH